MSHTALIYCLESVAASFFLGTLSHHHYSKVGFEGRVTFGTGQLTRPNLRAYSINIISASTRRSMYGIEPRDEALAQLAA